MPLNFLPFLNFLLLWLFLFQHLLYGSSLLYLELLHLCSFLHDLIFLALAHSLNFSYSAYILPRETTQIHSFLTFSLFALPLFSGVGDLLSPFRSLPWDRSEEEEPLSWLIISFLIKFHLLWWGRIGLRDLLLLWDLLRERCLLSLSSLYLRPDRCLECDLDRDLEWDLLERLKFRQKSNWIATSFLGIL